MTSNIENKEKYIELNTFIKLINLAQSGGQAKLLIRSGEIKVNNEIETRNRKKLYPNDIVEYENQKYKITKEIIK